MVRWKQRILAYGVILILLVVMSPMLLDWYVNKVTFYPMSGIDLEPGGWQTPVEQVWMTTEDGVRLHAFWLPVDGSRKVLLYFHGNAGNASHRLPVVTQMAAMGINVLLPDYRGYGLSDGKPDEAGLYLDARAALEFVRQRGFEDRDVLLFGRSLGGAVAIDLAQNLELGGVALCSTFSSASDMARAIGLGWMAPLVKRRFPSIDKIAAIRAPLLFMHGVNDEIVPYALGQKLFQAAPEPKRMVTLPDTGHNDVTVAAPEVFWPTVAEFVK